MRRVGYCIILLLLTTTCLPIVTALNATDFSGSDANNCYSLQIKIGNSESTSGNSTFDDPPAATQEKSYNEIIILDENISNDLKSQLKDTETELQKLEKFS